MDRRASIPPRRLTLPLVVVALAVLAHLAVRAVASSLPAGGPSVRIVFLRPPRAGTDLDRRPAPPEARHAEPRGQKLPPDERISMILGPVFPGGQDPPEKPADAVTIKWREPVSSPAGKGPLAATPLETPTRRDPPADPLSEETARKTRVSITVEPADPVAEAPTKPLVRPAPEPQAEPAEPDTAQSGPVLAPEEPADPVAERPTEPAVRTPPGGQPEAVELRAVEPDLLPAPRELPDAFPEQPAEPPVGPAPGRQPEPAVPRAALPNPFPAPREPAAMTPQRPLPLQGQPGSVLPPPPAVAGRSEQLERIAQQADRQIRRGFELASRGAYFAARSEFIKALRLVSQGLDTEHQTDLHSRSLAVGLAAISEAADFIPTGSRLEADLNLPAIIEGHRTPVLKNADTQHLTPLSALKCYFTFAQEQLAVAAGSEVAGSMALHALGKLHAALAGYSGGSVRAAESKAVAFYQAALLVYPKNLMAANDLGVLLARCGSYHEAEAALKYSLSINAQPTSWHNLAAVYQQLGQTALARQADLLSQAARQAEIDRRRPRQDPSRQLVRWVDPSAFNQFRTEDRTVPPPAAVRAEPPKAVEPSQPSRAAQKSTLGWLPWNMPEERR